MENLINKHTNNQLSSEPDESFSRNLPWALILIFSFLFCQLDRLDCCKVVISEISKNNILPVARGTLVLKIITLCRNYKFQK
jgi:hypothetical protein